MVFVWIPETKGIPIECMETLFSGPVRHAAWRQNKLYPPNGIPPPPQSLVADGRMQKALAGVEREAAEFEDKGELEHRHSAGTSSAA